MDGVISWVTYTSNLYNIITSSSRNKYGNHSCCKCPIFILPSYGKHHMPYHLYVICVCEHMHEIVICIQFLLLSLMFTNPCLVPLNALMILHHMWFPYPIIIFFVSYPSTMTFNIIGCNASVSTHVESTKTSLLKVHLYFKKMFPTLIAFPILQIWNPMRHTYKMHLTEFITSLSSKDTRFS